MNQPSKREREKQERREKRKDEILQAAEALFQEQGIRQTKMTDIAKACELGKGTLYFYFKSKDEIVWTLLKEHSVQEHTAGMTYVNEVGGNGYKKLERYFSLFSEELIENYSVSSPSFQYREYMSSMVTENNLTDSMKVEYKQIAERNISFVVQMIEEGIRDESISETLDPIAVGTAVSTAFGTYFRYVIGLEASFDDEYMAMAKSNFKVFTLLLLSAIKR